ncbi:MAG: hypothetical protein JNM84_05370 [Planctomycetes bacterium]|nr:hypothetical protein [Planctomycetota bacterium]
MNTALLLQITGNACVGLAALVLFFPLQRRFRDFARQYPSDNRWATPVLGALIPLWLLLLVALLCMTASGGFDGLRLGGPLLYAFAVGASGALATVNFVFIALYIRPGFTPRGIYTPGIFLTPCATGLLVVLSLYQKHAPGLPVAWLWWPWVIFAASSLALGAGFVGHRLFRTGFGVRELVGRILTARNTTPEHLAKIATLDPRSDFFELLGYASPYRRRALREAATARMRAHPEFVQALAANLSSSHSDRGLEFLFGSALAPDEQAPLALPARTALERFIRDIPAPNYITRARQKQLLRFGRKSFPVIMGRFSGTDVDFSQVMPAFEQALRPDDSRR